MTKTFMLCALTIFLGAASADASPRCNLIQEDMNGNELGSTELVVESRKSPDGLREEVVSSVVVYRNDGDDFATHVYADVFRRSGAARAAKTVDKDHFYQGLLKVAVEAPRKFDTAVRAEAPTLPSLYLSAADTAYGRVYILSCN